MFNVIINIYNKMWPYYDSVIQIFLFIIIKKINIINI